MRHAKKGLHAVCGACAKFGNSSGLVTAFDVIWEKNVTVPPMFGQPVRYPWRAIFGLHLRGPPYAAAHNRAKHPATTP
jgi:hypothetical protein